VSYHSARSVYVTPVSSSIAANNRCVRSFLSPLSRAFWRSPTEVSSSTSPTTPSTSSSHYAVRNPRGVPRHISKL